MPDKIENKPVVNEQQNQGNKLSDQAFDLLKQAALGGVAGAVLDSKTPVDVALGVGGAAVAGAIAAAKAAEKVSDKAMAAAGKAAVDAVIGGTVGGAAAKLGMELAKEHKNEIKKAGNIIVEELNKRIKEAMDGKIPVDKIGDNGQLNRKQQEQKNNENRAPENKAPKPAENAMQKTLDQVGDALKKEAERQLKELKETPQDVIRHFQKRPVTTITEGMLGGPGAVILDAKLRKWFGDK